MPRLRSAWDLWLPAGLRGAGPGDARGGGGVVDREEHGQRGDRGQGQAEDDHGELVPADGGAGGEAGLRCGLRCGGRCDGHGVCSPSVRPRLCMAGLLWSAWTLGPGGRRQIRRRCRACAGAPARRHSPSGLFPGDSARTVSPTARGGCGHNCLGRSRVIQYASTAIGSTVANRSFDTVRNRSSDQPGQSNRAGEAVAPQHPAYVLRSGTKW
jgi:hypothetical protein